MNKFFPFLSWFPLSGDAIRADLIAGITVALVLIPQSMAYAQLAGLPAYYGLYAAFLPGIIGALWGSSKQLATGPVAVVSLLTASALVPFATLGSEQFVALAIMLAMIVGLFQLCLGVFKLGVVVNFISHPVIVGFTNAVNHIFNYMQHQGHGHIANISSVAGLRGNHLHAAYHASKSYQCIYMEGLRKKSFKKQSNITVTDIRPGFVKTDFIKKMICAFKIIDEVKTRIYNNSFPRISQEISTPLTGVKIVCYYWRIRIPSPQHFQVISFRFNIRFFLQKC